MQRYVVLALLLLSGLMPGAMVAEEERKEGPLVVYGDDLMFVVKEPEGWQGDIENAPKMQAGVVLYRKTETFGKHGALIAVRVARKVDENTAEDLAHEMREFRRLYPDVRFGDLAVVHPAYAVFARTFIIPKSRHEYVVFLNPGAATPFLFSVAMSTGRQEARSEELQAFRAVIASLEFVSQEGVKPLR